MSIEDDETKGNKRKLFESGRVVLVNAPAGSPGTIESLYSRVVLQDAATGANRVDRNDWLGRRVNAKARRELKKSGFRGLHKMVADYLIMRWRAGVTKVQCREIELATNIPVNWIAKAVRDLGIDNRSLVKSGMKDWVYDIESMYNKPWFQEYTQGSGELR